MQSSTPDNNAYRDICVGRVAAVVLAVDGLRGQSDGLETSSVGLSFGLQCEHTNTREDGPGLRRYDSAGGGTSLDRQRRVNVCVTHSCTPRSA